jgi:chemotaxis protein CheZ
MAHAGLHDAERALVRGLSDALADDDASRFNELLDELLRCRESSLQTSVVRISSSLQDALLRFRMDSRIAVLTEKDIPDARQRLDHVVSLTEKAAHRTMDLIERSLPLAEATARRATELARLTSPDPKAISAFLEDARGGCEAVRANLSEVMLAQGFQDITGQILRSVHKLIGEVEGVLDQLMEAHGIPRDTGAKAQTSGTTLEGPAIPGITRNAVTDQGDIDDLMAGLGI